ncbi:hypothetical protein D1610_00920 [Sphingomonas gilva]|uniref:Uncharacterized protein n=1 Tax=Sphingomonas gilva TaxID=2305907 RepID=A0A396S5S0_9SPHN|nr:hypothetical protein [Sphingomonas gilva]RHW18755.1 hypothetical protein D1610_00920 [Sphingomonas gilva]
MRAIDWAVRTLLLVLAGMATLAVIGSIAAIPAGGLPQGIERMMPGESPQALAPGEPVTAGDAATTDQTVAPAPPPRPQADAWAESLTYAVIALAGIAAAGLIVLMRIAGHLGEIARRDRM